jgi:hypothetical protein
VKDHNLRSSQDDIESNASLEIFTDAVRVDRITALLLLGLALWGVLFGILHLHVFTTQHSDFWVIVSAIAVSGIASFIGGSRVSITRVCPPLLIFSALPHTSDLPTIGYGIPFLAFGLGCLSLSVYGIPAEIKSSAPVWLAVLAGINIFLALVVPSSLSIIRKLRN